MTFPRLGGGGCGVAGWRRENKREREGKGREEFKKKAEAQMKNSICIFHGSPMQTVQCRMYDSSLISTCKIKRRWVVVVSEFFFFYYFTDAVACAHTGLVSLIHVV